MGGLIVFGLIVLNIIAVWKIYEKAGIKGWRMFVPILGLFDFLKIIKRPWWWSLFLFIPFVNLLIIWLFAYDLAKVFGKGFGYSILILVGIGVPTLGLSENMQYLGENNTNIKLDINHETQPQKVEPSAKPSSSGDTKPKQKLSLFGKIQATGVLEKNNFVGTSTEKQILGAICFVAVLVLTVVQIKRLSSLDLDDLISTSENYFINKNYALAKKGLNKANLLVTEGIFDDHISKGLLLKTKIALIEKNLIEAENVLTELRKNNPNDLPKEFFYKVYLSHLELSELYFLNKEFEKSKSINTTLFLYTRSVLPIESLSFDPRFKTKYKEDLKYISDFAYKILNVYSIPESVYRSQFRNERSLVAYQNYRERILNNADKTPDSEILTAISYLPTATIVNPNQLIPLLNGLNRNYQDNLRASRIKKAIEFKIYPKMENDIITYTSGDLIFLPQETSRLKPKDIEACYNKYLTVSDSESKLWENLFLPVTNSDRLAECKQNLYQLPYLYKEGDLFKEFKPKSIQSRSL